MTFRIIIKWSLNWDEIPRNVIRHSSLCHFDDVIMSTIASQITSLTIVYSAIYSCADQSKHQSSASLAFVWGIHRGPVNSPHKWPVTRKMFPFDDVIMLLDREIHIQCHLNPVVFRYNTVRYNMILHISLQSLIQNACQSFNIQNTPHNSPYRVSYGVSFARNSETIDRVIATSHCSLFVVLIVPVKQSPDWGIYRQGDGLHCLIWWRVACLVPNQYLKKLFECW